MKKSIKNDRILILILRIHWNNYFKEEENMITAILFLSGLAISVVFTMYFALKDSNNAKLSKSVLYSFRQKGNNDNLDELIEFSKTHIHKYKI